MASRGDADPGTLFVRLDGSALTLKPASDALRRLMHDLGLKPLRGRAGARPYEFRHAFAVHRLTAWATDGVDVHAVSDGQEPRVFAADAAIAGCERSRSR